MAASTIRLLSIEAPSREILGTQVLSGAAPMAYVLSSPHVDECQSKDSLTGQTVTVLFFLLVSGSASFIVYCTFLL